VNNLLKRFDIVIAKVVEMDFLETLKLADTRSSPSIKGLLMLQNGVMREMMLKNLANLKDLQKEGKEEREASEAREELN
jgi:hypothetical protein